MRPKANDEFIFHSVREFDFFRRDYHLRCAFASNGVELLYALRDETDPRARMTISSSQWWLYLLGCKDGRTYAGVALDVEARFKAHAEGKGAKFTRSNPPICILGAQRFVSKSDALKAEHALKSLSREHRLAWAKQNPPGNAPAP